MTDIVDAAETRLLQILEGEADKHTLEVMDLEIGLFEFASAARDVIDCYAAIRLDLERFSVETSPLDDAIIDLASALKENSL